MKRYFTEQEMCEEFSISRNTVRKYFSYAQVRIGRCVRYDMHLVEGRKR